MPVNIIEKIQQNLGIGEIEKINPNTQEPQHHGHTLAQGTIPTVLLGLYKYANTEHGADRILHGSADNWVDEFFGSHKQEAAEKISSYTGNEVSEVTGVMERVANEAVRLLRENAPANATPELGKSYIMQQRSEILKRLPAELQAGDLFGDDTIDDRTNKMEGPMSNHMHWLEKLFSGGTPEVRKKDKNA
jgi:hypothetical protein